jgi:hypothetical protein
MIGFPVRRDVLHPRRKSRDGKIFLHPLKFRQFGLQALDLFFKLADTFPQVLGTAGGKGLRIYQLGKNKEAQNREKKNDDR